MASELKRRLQTLERHSGIIISQLLCTQYAPLPLASASFEAMLRTMPPATARLFLYALPEDLHL